MFFVSMNKLALERFPANPPSNTTWVARWFQPTRWGIGILVIPNRLWLNIEDMFFFFKWGYAKLNGWLVYFMDHPEHFYGPWGAISPRISGGPAWNPTTEEMTIQPTTSNTISGGFQGQGGTPKMDGLFHGTSQSKIDDDEGYPYFRTPPSHRWVIVGEIIQYCYYMSAIYFLLIAQICLNMGYSKFQQVQMDSHQVLITHARSWRSISSLWETWLG